MFGISLPETLVILSVALVIMGPSDLLSLCTTLGRKIRQAKSALNSLSLSAQEYESPLLKASDKITRDTKSTLEDLKSEVNPLSEISRKEQK